MNAVGLSNSYLHEDVVIILKSINSHFETYHGVIIRDI
jgi:ATP-dependent Clp protease ATP-binding subunit ClpA